MLFGKKRMIISAENKSDVYKEILYGKFPVTDMQEKKDKIYLWLSLEYCEDFENMCIEKGFEYEYADIKGLIVFFSRFKHRWGLLAGLILTIILTVYLSNIALRFKILCDDKQIQKDVMTVLKEEGVEPGCYIPNIDLVVTERALKQRVHGISWAGITRSGSSLVIDVVKDIPKPDINYERLPTNLIATENAVIDKLEIFGGQVMLGVGCGVNKGDVIVSGKEVDTKSKWVNAREQITTRITYTRSKGTVWGSFQRRMTFEQPYHQQTQVKGKVNRKCSFGFFNAEVPLYFSLPENSFKTDCQKSDIMILGFKMPFYINHYTLTEYSYSDIDLNKGQAENICLEKVSKYEKNFLKDYDIKKKKVKKSFSKSGCKIIVDYDLYGSIATEQEFFIPKNVIKEETEVK